MDLTEVYIEILVMRFILKGKKICTRIYQSIGFFRSRVHIWFYVCPSGLSIASQERKKGNIVKSNIPREVGDAKLCMNPPRPTNSVAEDALHVKHACQGDIPFSGPLLVSASNGFAWAKKQRENTASLKSHRRSNTRSHGPSSLDFSNSSKSSNAFDLKGQTNGDFVTEKCTDSKGHDSFELAKRALMKQWAQLERLDSFDAFDIYHSQELSATLYQKDEMASRQHTMGFQDQGEKVEFSGFLLTQVIYSRVNAGKARTPYSSGCTSIVVPKR